MYTKICALKVYYVPGSLIRQYENLSKAQNLKRLNNALTHLGQI